MPDRESDDIAPDASCPRLRGKRYSEYSGMRGQRSHQILHIRVRGDYVSSEP